MKVFQADQSELKRINAYFEQHGINTVFDADFELLKMYMSHPEKEITSHVMEALKRVRLSFQMTPIFWLNGPKTF